MPKVDLELVKVILQRNELDVRQVAHILEEINQELAAMLDEEKPPAVKKQYVMVVSDPRGQLDGKDFTGWVVQIPEEASVVGTEERIIKAAQDFNTSPKGRRLPAKTVAEVCEHVPARFLKEQQVWVRTKEPVYVVATANKLPKLSMEKTSRED
ncbi:MAG TPA: hypothetical protein VK737_03785 [Opitutales bacterium]|jgi:hypothetical protein|nr:hypothetical protein [Opitutales bacterium]